MTRRVEILTAVSLVAILLAPWIGAPLDEDTARFVLIQLRLPRVLLAALVGAALGLTGAAFQTVLENPLATPSTVGTTAGAGLGALAMIVGLPAGMATAPMVALGAFAGAATVSFAVAGLAASRRLRTEDLLLAGIAVSLAAGAATTGLQLQADAAATVASVRWSLGTVATVGFGEPLRLLPFVLLGGAVMLRHRPALQAMAVGTDRAQTQGVDVPRTRTQVLTAGSLAVGACVAVTGPIGFVGLIVPHLVRLVVRGGPRVLLPASAIAGAGFLPLADALARAVTPAHELPVGVLTAALGAPTLIALLLRERQP